MVEIKGEIKETSTIQELKAFAALNEIEIPNNVTVKASIFKLITEEIINRQDNRAIVEATTETEDTNGKETPEESGEILEESTPEPETSEIEGEELLIDHVIVREDSLGVHTYNRDTGISTFKRHEVL